MSESDNDQTIETQTVTHHAVLDKKSPEYIALASKPPLKTILVLSIGPILSQLTNALYGVITTIWVSKFLHEVGMASISTYSALDTIGRSFGSFIGCAASTEISSLFGSGKGEEASQIVSDMIRVSFICGIIVPCIILPIAKPMAKWFGATQEVIDMGFDYILPLFLCMFSTCIYLGIGGCLQGEGRTLIYGIMNIIVLVLNMAVLDPLFLYLTNWGILSVSIATVVSEFLPTIVIVILYYKGKFSCKPRPGDLLKKFSSHTLPALKTGSSQLVSSLSVMLPAIVVRKFLGMALDQADYNNAMAAYNSAQRINMIVYSVILGLVMAFVPAASYSYAAGMLKRWLVLMVHSLWTCAVWGSIMMILTWVVPKPFCLIFSSGEGYLRWAEPMLQVMNGLGVISGCRFNSQTILQSIKKPTLAMILSLINQFVAICVFAVILYYTGKHDAVRIIWCYPLSNAFGAVTSVIFLIKPVKDIYKRSKEEVDEESEHGLEELDNAGEQQQSLNPVGAEPIYSSESNGNEEESVSSSKQVVNEV